MSYGAAKIAIRLLLASFIAAMCSSAFSHERPDVIDEVIAILEQSHADQNQPFLGHLKAAYQLELERDPNNPELLISIALIDLTRVTQIINLEYANYQDVAQAMQSYQNLVNDYPDALNGNAHAISENIHKYLAPAPYSYSNGRGFLKFLQSLKSPI